MKEKRLFIFIIVFGYICVFLHAQATCHITDSVAQHNESIKFISGGLEYQIMPDDSLWAEVSSPAKDLTDYQYPKTLVIPAEINYKGQIYKVHTICNLKKSIDIDTLVISEGILRIREHAFCNNAHLKSVHIPSTIKEIGKNFLAGCTNLTSITVNKDNNYYDSRNNCNGLIDTQKNSMIAGCVSTEIPASITEISDGAFSSCKKLKSINIPEGVKVIGYEAFCNCVNLEKVTLPKTLNIIKNWAFCGCSSLESIYIPENVQEIYGGNILSNCIRLKEISVSKKNQHFSSKKEALLDKSGKELIVGCKATKIPRSVRTLCCDCFSGHGLTEIFIPRGVDSIQIAAVTNSPELYRIEVAKRNKTFDSRNNCNAIISSSTDCLVAGCSATRIPKSVTSIGSYAFNGNLNPNKSLNLIVPDGITEINRWAFKSCDGLAYLYIPATVKKIGVGAFSDCRNLSTVNITSKDIDIDPTSFDGCFSATILDANGDILPMEKEYW